RQHMQTELIGYPDRWSVAAGEAIRFMVSTDAPSYNVSFVRLIHADDNPAGPGIKEEQIDAPHVGRQAGRKQITRTGSYIEVPASPTLAALTSFTLQAWIFPTLPGQGKAQTILAYGTQENGFCLFIDERGCLSFRVGSAVPIRIEIPLR